MPRDERRPEGETSRLLTELGAPQPAATAPLDDPPSAPPPAADLALPPTLGPYALRGELGRGGMGVVLEAEDLEIQRRVAVKVLREGLAADAAAIQRFVAEARITGQLEHPGVVPVYNLGVTQAGRLYFAMRRVEGPSLRQVLREGAWSQHRLLVAFTRVAQAVAYAHQRGVVHRDIKPANVILGELGQVFLVDWGIAAPIGDEAPLAAGTHGYISPERWQGEPAGAAGDVWALGAVLYEILALRPAFPGERPADRQRAVLAGPPADPRAAAPDADIPAELAEICLRALAPDPASRTPSAGQLAAEIEVFLEGSRRRARAGELLAQARQGWAALRGLQAEESALQDRESTLHASVPPWAPLAEKGELLAARERLAEIEALRLEGFEEVLATCERALAQDPGSRAARGFLAAVYWERLQEAEAAGDRAATARFRRRVAAYDDGSYAERLRGDGSLTLRTDPPGAAVLAQEVDRHGAVWTLGPARPLGRTPLKARSLPMGSWVLTLQRDGYEDVTYPILVTRGRRLDGGAVRLPRPGEIAPGFAYVPPGPYLRGGDPESEASRPRGEVWVGGFAMAVFPVTLAEYIPFLDDLPAEEAWRRCPRQDEGPQREGRRYLARGADGRWRLPEEDEWGPWDLRWPVHSLSWEDGGAYAAWRSRREGRRLRLPTEDEFEKAARGADGRTYPWGDGFDPSLCKMSQSRPGTPMLEPVGAFPSDASVYGVRDLAGGMRTWCAEDSFDGDPRRRPVRGGSFATPSRVSRCAIRYGSPAGHALPYQGIRLVQALDWSQE